MNNVKIDGETFQLRPVTITIDGSPVTKNLPEGWVLVSPTDKILEGDIVLYSSSGSSNPLDLSPSRRVVKRWTRRSAAGGGLIEEGDIYEKVALKSDLWRLVRRLGAALAPTATACPGETSEHQKLFNFFFPGMKMSDPSKLPPAPRALGRSWDNLADD